jgi:hypothetical protein
MPDSRNDMKPGPDEKNARIEKVLRRQAALAGFGSFAFREPVSLRRRTPRTNTNGHLRSQKTDRAQMTIPSEAFSRSPRLRPTT